MTDHAFTDLNVADHPTGNPFDHTDPVNDVADLQVQANPTKAMLAAMASDLIAGVATLNWQPNNVHVRGEVAAVKRCMARILEHQYGAEYGEAFRRVEKAVNSAVGTRKIQEVGFVETRDTLPERVLADLYLWLTAQEQG